MGSAQPVRAETHLRAPQPTPELCRFYHGVDCRGCVHGFSALDRIVTLEQHWNADSFRRDFDESARRVQEWERKWKAWTP